MTAATLILVRHGETDWNLHHRFQGQSDVPMNDSGRDQAAAAADHLRGVHAAAIYCSDLVRCRQTAEIIGSVVGVAPTVAVELRERSFGRIEGLTRDEAAARFPESWEQRRRDSPAWVPPGGESLGEMWKRILTFTEDLWRRHQGQTFVIAGHGGPLKAIICSALGAGEQGRMRFAISNGSITVIRRNEAGSVVELMNETCHLGEIPGDVEAD